jgi:hypothetical protein
VNVLLKSTPFLAMGIGLLGLFSLLDSWINSHSLDEWQTTEGEISYSELAHGSGVCGPGLTIASMVGYDFKVDGVTYYSTHISYGADALSCGRELADTYPAGKKVTVYYDPENPDNSVLKKTGMNVFISILIGLLSMGMIVIGYFSWRLINEENKT